MFDCMKYYEAKQGAWGGGREAGSGFRGQVR